MGETAVCNGADRREAEDIKRRWQGYTEELHKKGINDRDNHNGVVTCLEPNILECEIKWVLETLLWRKVAEVIEFQMSNFKS